MNKPLLLAIALLGAGTAAAQTADTLASKESVYDVEQISVVGDRSKIVFRVDKRIIDAATNLVGSGGTAVDILENTPSIRVDADGEVTFRGSAGFRVYVDGKPSVLSGTQALQQVPAGNIDNIEIITTPSARYDTDGEAGMINIVTKKGTRQGVNGMVNAGVGVDGSNSVDFHLSRQGEKLGWHVAGHWRNPLRESDFNQRKETTVGGATTSSISNGPRGSESYHKGLSTGLTYNFTPRTSVNAEASVVNNKNTRWGNLDYEEVASGVRSGFISRDGFLLQATVITGSVGFEHKFNDRGHNLTGGFLAASEPDGYEVFESRLFDHGDALQQGHVAIEDEFRWTVRSNLDYVLPYSSTGRIEAGWQFHSYLEDGDYEMSRFDPAKGDFVVDGEIYNTFRFQQGIHSLYLIGADGFGDLTVQAGVRGEHTHRILRSSIPGAPRTTKRFEIFPSVHLGYDLPHDRSLTLAYSYRTNRPNIWWMEPYVTYSDFYTAQIGNPDIKPEYINSTEMTYKRFIGEHVVQASVFYRARRDKIERLRIPYQAGVTLDSMANVGNDHALGLELSAQLKLARGWDLNVMGNVYHYRVRNLATAQRQRSVNYDATLNNLFRVGRTTRLQVDGNFVGPTVTTQGRSEAFWFVNLAVRQQLFSPNLQATLSFRDVFDSARYRNEVAAPDLSSVTRIRPRWPVVNLSVSCTFNNYKRSDGAQTDNRDLFEGTNY